VSRHSSVSIVTGLWPGWFRDATFSHIKYTDRLWGPLNLLRASFPEGWSLLLTATYCRV